MVEAGDAGRGLRDALVLMISVVEECKLELCRYTYLYNGRSI